MVNRVMSARTKLLEALRGFEPHPPGHDEHIYAFDNVSTGNYDPPAYIVAFLFLSVLGYSNFGSAEKVWWHTFFTYRGYLFLIRDYKFGTWSLEVPKGEKLPDEILRQVIAKIQSASRHADDLLSHELKKKISEEKFWIHNGYSGLRAAFDFYAKELRGAIAELDTTLERHAKSKPTLEKHFERLNERADLERIVSYRAFPLFVSFFSLLEFILDAFYAFQRPSISFFEFRRKVWEERFKKLVPLAPGSDVLRKYEQLFRIKALFRNPLTHGLTNETSLLVPVPFGGLVPVTYEHLESSVHFGMTAISRNVAMEALETFERMLAYFNDIEPYAYYMRYVDHGFSIPVQSSEIAGIRAEMVSLEAFEEYLEQKSQYLDAVTNRDI